jgi:hypothetical protein
MSYHRFESLLLRQGIKTYKNPGIENFQDFLFYEYVSTVSLYPSLESKGILGVSLVWKRRYILTVPGIACSRINLVILRLHICNKKG